MGTVKSGKKAKTTPDKNPKLVLPRFYYKAAEFNCGKNFSDEVWITDQLNILNEASRDSIIHAYSRIYKERFSLEELDYKKDNKARYAANMFLLDVREKQVNDEKSAVYKPQPKSWEIIAHLKYYPLMFFERKHWHSKYLRYMHQMHPHLVSHLYKSDLPEDDSSW